MNGKPTDDGQTEGAGLEDTIQELLGGVSAGSLMEAMTRRLGDDPAQAQLLMAEMMDVLSGLDGDNVDSLIEGGAGRLAALLGRQED